MHCVDLGESFPRHILLQNLASIQPISSPVKFARSPRTDPPGLEKRHEENVRRSAKNVEAGGGPLDPVPAAAQGGRVTRVVAPRDQTLTESQGNP